MISRLLPVASSRRMRKAESIVILTFAGIGLQGQADESL